MRTITQARERPGPKEGASGGAQKGGLILALLPHSARVVRRLGGVWFGAAGGDHSTTMIEQWIETLRRGECIKEHELKKLCNLVR